MCLPARRRRAGAPCSRAARRSGAATGTPWPRRDRARRWSRGRSRAAPGSVRRPRARPRAATVRRLRSAAEGASCPALARSGWKSEEADLCHQVDDGLGVEVGHVDGRRLELTERLHALLEGDVRVERVLQRVAVGDDLLPFLADEELHELLRLVLHVARLEDAGTRDAHERTRVLVREIVLSTVPVDVATFFAVTLPVVVVDDAD